jgi:hypothetical protein
MTRPRTPLAVFTYNRPGHTRRALDALSACAGLDDCAVTLYSDGARSESDAAGVAATRAVLRQWAGAHGARVVERPENLGLARSIVTGVSAACAEHGRVIVLEDDLLVHPDFLRFMIGALDRYEDAPQVMQVGGLTLSPPPEPGADAFLLPVTTTWGWATWQRAWQGFRWEPQDLDAARRDDAWLQRFGLHGAGAYLPMLEDRLAGRNDSWGILWWYAVSRAGGLVVYPSRNLVWNVGFDGSGTHCGEGDVLGLGPDGAAAAARLPATLRFPRADDLDPSHLARLEAFLRSRAASAAAITPGIAGGTRDRLAGAARRLMNRLRHARA